MNTILNKHKFENRLIDENGNLLWFKIYLLEEIENYEEYNNLIEKKLFHLLNLGKNSNSSKVSDLLCAVLVIRSVFKDFNEVVLEVKIENKEEKETQYIEYLYKEISNLEYYQDGSLIEFYSKIIGGKENKPLYIKKDLEDLNILDTEEIKKKY